MTIQQLWTPVKRELWEHKVGLLWMPAAIALLLVLFFIYISIGHGFGVGNFSDSQMTALDAGGSHFSAEFNGQAEGADLAANMAQQFMFFVIGLITFLLWLPIAMVLLAYAHSTLFSDRASREILFWRSMPVSETQNVLTKFFVIGVFAPTLVFLLTLASVLLFLLANVLLGSNGNFADIPILFSLGLTVKAYGMVLYNLIVLFPFFAWMIFSSAAAKKSPFMFSSMIPVALVVLDKIAHSFFGLDLQVIAVFSRYWNLLRVVGFNDESLFTPALMLPLTLVLLVGGLLVFATIWLRNHRYEI